MSSSRLLLMVDFFIAFLGYVHIDCSDLTVSERTAPSVGEYPFSFSEKDSRRRWIKRPKSLNPSPPKAAPKGIFPSRSLSPSKCNLSIFQSFTAEGSPAGNLLIFSSISPQLSTHSTKWYTLSVDFPLHPKFPQ